MLWRLSVCNFCAILSGEHTADRIRHDVDVEVRHSAQALFERHGDYLLDLSIVPSACRCGFAVVIYQVWC